MTSAFKMTKCIREKNLSYISIYIIQLCRTIILQVFELVAVDSQRHTQRGVPQGHSPLVSEKSMSSRGFSGFNGCCNSPWKEKKSPGKIMRKLLQILYYQETDLKAAPPRTQNSIGIKSIFKCLLFKCFENSTNKKICKLNTPATFDNQPGR